jgi:hypothetical protein
VRRGVFVERAESFINAAVRSIAGDNERLAWAKRLVEYIARLPPVGLGECHVISAEEMDMGVSLAVAQDCHGQSLIIDVAEISRLAIFGFLSLITDSLFVDRLMARVTNLSDQVSLLVRDPRFAVEVVIGVEFVDVLIGLGFSVAAIAMSLGFLDNVECIYVEPLTDIWAAKAANASRVLAVVNGRRVVVTRAPRIVDVDELPARAAIPVELLLPVIFGLAME